MPHRHGHRPGSACWLRCWQFEAPVQQLLVQALRAYAQIRDACQRLLEASRSSDAAYGSYAARQLQFYSERCQSLNLLLQHGKLWDCDILTRPALECATRFIFVSIAEPEERARRIREYSVDLNELEELQLSEKAKASAASMPRSDNKTIIDFIVLSQEREADLRARWPKPKRTALKQKWSFTEMVRVIAACQLEELDLRGYPALLHTYGISSHLIHADQTALDVILDRSRRGPAERKALTDAHYARLCTEQVSIFFMCWRALAFALRMPEQNPDLVLEVAALNEAADAYHRTFVATQVNLYGGSAPTG